MKQLLSVFLMGGWLAILLGGSVQAAHIENKKYFVDAMPYGSVQELVFDGGYQSYCAKDSGPPIIDFDEEKYRGITLNMDGAYVPLLRDDGGVSSYRGSVEAYHGYQAPEENMTLLHQKNSFVVDEQYEGDQCVTRVKNLKAIWYMCETAGAYKMEELCEDFACVEGRWDEIALELNPPGTNSECPLYEDNKVIGNTRLSIPQLIETYIVPAVQNGVKPEDACNYFIAPDDLATLDMESEKGQILLAIRTLMNRHFYIDSIFRIGYIIEAVKLCDPMIHLNSYEDVCDWEVIPDYMRFFPFALPDVLTNTQSNAREFHYIDPSHFTYQLLAGDVEQKDYYKIIQSEKKAVVDAEITEETKVIDCENCDSGMRYLFEQLINKTAAENSFNERYLGEPDSDMSCETPLSKGESIPSSGIKSSAKPPEAAKVGDEIPEGYYKCRAWNDALGDCGQVGYSKSGIYECMRCGEEAACGGGNVDRVRCTEGKVRYWGVTPQGYEIERIEQQMRALYALEETWDKIRENDARMKKRLEFNNLKTQDGKTMDISILGGEATDILNLQTSHYTKETEFWLGMKECKDLNEYLSNSCGGKKTGNINKGGLKTCEINLPEIKTGPSQSWQITRVTSYYVVQEDLEYPNSNCYIANGTWKNGCDSGFVSQVNMQGTGYLKDGTQVKYHGGYTLPEDLTVNCYGTGSAGGVVPFRTLASCPANAGRVVYIPDYDGHELPDGTRHDGCFLITDTGGAFPNGAGCGYIDIFTWTKHNAWNVFPTTKVTKTATMNATECDGVDFTVPIGIP